MVSRVILVLPTWDGGRGEWGERSKGKRPRGWKEPWARGLPGRMVAAVGGTLCLPGSLLFPVGSGCDAFHLSVPAWQGPGPGGRGPPNSRSWQHSHQRCAVFGLSWMVPWGRQRGLVWPRGRASDRALMPFGAGATSPTAGTGTWPRSPGWAVAMLGPAFLSRR